jgi:hypothetical protein
MKTTVMPDRDEMLRRLASVNDSPWNVERFYPLIAEAADTERVGFGLPLLFETAIADVSDGDPLGSALRFQVPARLRALVDDAQVLDEALAAFYEINPWLRDAGAVKP